jgi:phage replication-related protein YjqB (UPF0714/DUF867 family)
MASADASIIRARPFQADLKARREHCSVDPARLASVGRAVTHQIRIYRTDKDFGLYTVSEVRPESPDTIVHMGLTGRRRLGTDDEFDGRMDSRGPQPGLPEDQAREQGELIELLDDDGRQTRLIAIAPHGGEIEPHTDEQAERVASRLAAKSVSCWRCKGWNPDGDPFDRWHITSTDLNEACFPLLAQVMSRRFTHAVAFHGLKSEDPDRPEIIIGGTAPDDLKEEIRAAIDGAIAGSGIEVRIATGEDLFGGDDGCNIVNRLTIGRAGGIQIEQTPEARTSHWPAIAGAVADVYALKLDELE